MYTVDQYDDQGTGHNDTLDQVGGTCCQESSQRGVSYDNNSTYDHGSTPNSVANSLPQAANPDAVYGTKKITIIIAEIASRELLLSR